MLLLWQVDGDRKSQKVTRMWTARQWIAVPCPILCTSDYYKPREWAMGLLKRLYLPNLSYVACVNCGGKQVLKNHRRQHRSRQWQKLKIVCIGTAPFSENV
jgi:hypothetical protein